MNLWHLLTDCIQVEAHKLNKIKLLSIEMCEEE